MIDLYFIKILDIEYLTTTLKSFYSTMTEDNLKNFTISIVHELDTREATLNYILTQRDLDNDLLIIADDIYLTEGWYQALQSNLDKGDILGFTMVKPKKAKIHNNGFDFILKDDELTYIPHMAGENVNIRLEPCRECDAIVGCTMFIKQKVLSKNISFPLDGYNRWGELIYCVLASQHSFKTVVLSHILYHESISSKQKKEVKYSSISWLVEKKLWKNVVKNYLQSIKPLKNYHNSITPTLQELFLKKEKILLYGCGTIADTIMKQVDTTNIDIASGLEEEIGLEFHNKKIYNINTIEKKNYQKIVLTPIGYEDEIIEKYFSEYKENLNIIKLQKKEKNNIFKIGLLECTQQI